LKSSELAVVESPSMKSPIKVAPNLKSGGPVIKIQFVLAIILSVVWLIPIAWIILVSFKPEGSNLTGIHSWVSPPFSFQNYLSAFNTAPVLLWIWNSFIVAALTTILVLVLSILCAFPFSQRKFPGQHLFMGLIAVGLMVPGAATLVPLYLIFRDLHLLNSFQSMILPGIAVPFGVLLMKQFFDGLPNELFEAATMDGATVMRMIMSIAVPLSRPALGALSIFTFLGSWNNFLWPFIDITNPKIMTIPVGIPFFDSGYHVDITLPMAANVIVSIPVLIAFLIFQKQIIRGISFTGLK
jgi:multiple sugar transport system permease protein